MTLTLPAPSSTTHAWIDVCPLDDLLPDRGVCALAGGRQVAVFRVWPDDSLYALSNHDPHSGANVLSRGIVGCRDGVPKVASPMYKHSFDLASGRCLDHPDALDHAVATFAVRCVHGMVQVAVP